MIITDILDLPELESFTFEMKARLDRENTEGWLKTISGFSNAKGGCLLIGVEDKSGKLIGFERKDADNERNYFNNQVNEHLFPRPVMSISFVPYENKGHSLYLIKVDISESPIKPVVLTMHGKPSIYMRRDGFTNGATYEEIVDMCLKCSRIQYDMTDSELDYDSTEFSHLRKFCKDHNQGKELSEKALASLGFFSKDKRVRNGGVLFSDHYCGDKTRVQCSVFSGFTRGSERIVTVNRFEGNLTDSIDFMREFVLTRMNHSLIKHEDRHEIIDAYPHRALFEGIINAVAHRDYYLDGTQIQLDMFKDRLEISSPGGFYQAERLGKTYNLSNIISKRRNELICGVLVACGVMEAAGTGFDKISEDYKNADFRHKPYVMAASDHFTLVLPDMTYADGVADANALADISFTPLHNGSRYDEKILSFCYEERRSAGEIASFLGIADSSYFRKNILNRLVESKYLMKERNGGSYRYWTNRELVEADI